VNLFVSVGSSSLIYHNPEAQNAASAAHVHAKLPV